jgi:hypothetical protein
MSTALSSINGALIDETATNRLGWRVSASRSSAWQQALPGA